MNRVVPVAGALALGALAFLGNRRLRGQSKFAAILGSLGVAYAAFQKFAENKEDVDTGDSKQSSKRKSSSSNSYGKTPHSNRDSTRAGVSSY